MVKARSADTALRVSAVTRAIESDLQRDWSVADMAAVLGVSDGQLRRLVAEGVGATPRHRFRAAKVPIQTAIGVQASKDSVIPDDDDLAIRLHSNVCHLADDPTRKL